MGKQRKKNPKFTHEAKMIVVNENPKKVPPTVFEKGFKWVEVEITDRSGKKTRDIIMLHPDQIDLHRK